MVPGGLESVIDAVLPAASKVAGTAACSSVALTNVTVTAVPFQNADVVGRKFVPTMSSEVSALPAGRLAGEIEVITGKGITTLND